MITRRKFMTISAVGAVGLPAISPATQGTDLVPAKAQATILSSAQGVPDRPVSPDDPVELMLDKFFGKKRNEPVPLPTIEHLDPSDFFFVAFTDAHMLPVGVRRYQGYLIIDNWRVAEVVRQVNALHPEFAIHIGDNIWGAPWDPEDNVYTPAAEAAKEIFSKFQCPFHNVPGTHDFAHHFDRIRASSYRLDTEQFTKYFGEIFYSFEVKQCRFIVYNNALAGAKVPEAIRQDKWMEEELPKASKAPLAFFFSHEPFFWLSPDEDGIDSTNTYVQPARTELLGKLAANGVDFIYSGHTHFEFANQYQNMYLHTLPSCTNNRTFLSSIGPARPFPALAEIHDPYKFGYLVVRVRDGKAHESWVSTYWRVNDPPPELAPLCGPRMVCRPATEVEDSVLGTTAPPPPEVVKPERTSFQQAAGSIINDHLWRAGENMGSKWLQVWPARLEDDEWPTYLDRGLSLGRPRGVKIAVPVPCDIMALGKAWSKLAPRAAAVAAVVVSNGTPSLFPTLYNEELTSWRMHGGPSEWVEGCREAKRIVPASTKVILGRIPLRELYYPWERHNTRASFPDVSSAGVPGSGLKNLEEIITAASGSADGIAVWVRCHGHPEAYAEELASAAEMARSHGLELWLDAAGWEYIDASMRPAYLLRLMALCEAHRIRLFWWNGPANEGGFLDGFYDPTPMYYAAQAWQTFVNGPVEPVKVEIGDAVTLRWKDGGGRQYSAWWRPSQRFEVQTAWKGMEIPSGAMAADPLHGRLLSLKQGTGLPLCSWPLILRWA